MTELLICSTVMAAAGALAGLISRVVPPGRAFQAATRTIQRALRTLKRPNVSDHWKERAMRGYSVRMLAATARVCGLMMLVLGPAIIAAWLLDLTVLPGLMAFALTPAGLLAATIGAVSAIGLWRGKYSRPVSAYTVAEKLLHRLALGSKAVSEISFDIDQSITRNQRRDAANEAHVFVTGLARAGTTALMRNIYDSGEFRSLLYEDMPFVLAPNLWRRLRGTKHPDKSEAAKERAHGDGLMVNSQSPESLDEVFWRVFDGENYIGPQALRPHRPTAELRRKYRDYVGAVLAEHPGKRYLSKNNNNILRLNALCETFPEAHILIIMRHPLDHAASLWRQHVNFTAQQGQDPFVGRYMGWLAHHEFGADHRPFEPDAANDATPDQLIYWLRQWIAVYERILKNIPDKALLICYETLCSDPSVWRGIATRIGITAGTPHFRQPVHNPVEIRGYEEEIQQAKWIYDNFRRRCHQEVAPEIAKILQRRAG